MRSTSRKKARQQDLEELAFEEMTPRAQRRNVKPIRALTEAQGQLIAQIASKDVIFATGPAGSGKTYIATSLTGEQLAAKNIERIIITRPMTPCEEDMGFLPGEQDQKYEPWVAPMMEVLEERLGKNYVKWAIKNGVIACRPLMFMRGASFKDAWIILDEAQNTTPGQMKMFLSRIGENCKMIIGGDVRQSDLRDRRGALMQNGLQDAIDRLWGMPEIGFVNFTDEDIVRHGIIRKILARYE